VGVIVEIQVSFIAVPIRDNKWKINSILWSINLFDGKFTQVCMFPITPPPSNNYKTVPVNQDAFVRRVMHRKTHEERPKASLKRKVGYIEELEQVSSTTRARMAIMHIDSDTPNEGSEIQSRSELD
jgi:hypothetical protein